MKKQEMIIFIPLILLYSKTCLYGHLYIKDNLYIKDTFLQSLWCPLNTGFTVFNFDQLCFRRKWWYAGKEFSKQNAIIILSSNQ